MTRYMLWHAMIHYMITMIHYAIWDAMKCYTTLYDTLYEMLLCAIWHAMTCYDTLLHYMICTLYEMLLYAMLCSAPLSCRKIIRAVQCLLFPTGSVRAGRHWLSPSQLWDSRSPGSRCGVATEIFFTFFNKIFSVTQNIYRFYKIFSTHLTGRHEVTNKVQQYL